LPFRSRYEIAKKQLREILAVMTKPILTKKRIVIAYTIAIIADLIEFPISALELTVIAAPVAMFMSLTLDVFVFGIMTFLLGFHWLLLPSFLVEVVPGLDMLPTWVGCVWFVVRQRKKEQNFSPTPTPKIIKEQNAIDI
jgi:hypothetical protein